MAGRLPRVIRWAKSTGGRENSIAPTRRRQPLSEGVVRNTHARIGRRRCARQAHPSSELPLFDACNRSVLTLAQGRVLEEIVRSSIDGWSHNPAARARSRPGISSRSLDRFEHRQTTHHAHRERPPRWPPRRQMACSSRRTISTRGCRASIAPNSLLRSGASVHDLESRARSAEARWSGYLIVGTMFPHRLTPGQNS